MDYAEQWARARAHPVGAYLTDRCRVDGECWLWSMACTSTGWPATNAPRLGIKNPVRDIWKALRATVPTGYWLTNRCDDRRCLNPWHWAQIRRGDVVARTWASGRRSGHRAYLSAIKGHAARKDAKGSFERAAQARALRAEGLTARQIGARLGVHASTAKRWYLGKSWRLAPLWSPIGAQAPPE